MLYGWVNESSERQTGDDAWTNGLYFCGDENDGAQASGCALIDVVDDRQDDRDQSYYFYFDASNGKKVKATDASELKSKTINGLKYSFNESGKMVSEWAMPKAPVDAASVSSYHYFNLPEQGWRAKSWFNVVPEKDVYKSTYDYDSAKWFYAENDCDIVKSKIKTINSKKYAFNSKGEMLSGVQAMTSISDIVGNKAIDDADLVDALKDGTLTFDGYNGKSYKIGKFLDNPKSAVGNNSAYVVNTSGSIMKNKKNLKDTVDY